MEDTIQSQLKINNVLKDFSSLDKKQIGEIYQNIADACIHNDEYASVIGIAIENQFGREVAVITSDKTAQIYKEQMPKTVVLDLSAEDEENFEQMLSDFDND